MHDLILSVYIILLVGVLNCPTVCTSGAVRLVGGASSREGKLEYCHNGAWSSVCINFDDEEATVACKQLGFSGSPSKNIMVCRKHFFHLVLMNYCRSNCYC